MILVFLMLSFKPTFSTLLFTFMKMPFSSSSLTAIRVVSSAYLRKRSWYSVIDVLLNDLIVKDAYWANEK